MKIENKYDFKLDLLNIHKKNLRDNTLVPNKNDYVFSDGVVFVYTDDSLVVNTAIKDFVSFLFQSMDISASYSKREYGNNVISLSLSSSVHGYMGYKITTDNNSLKIEGADERGLCQALYYLEDVMSERKAPFIPSGTVKKHALFSPRVTQSPFGMYSYPDEAFAIMSHFGFDAVEIWLKDAYTDLRDNYIDLKLISERAKKYGIDIYVELYAPHTAHPADYGAQEFYDKLYGELFNVCPDIKGIMVEGESTQFPSRDKNVGLSPYDKNFQDNIPTGKISPGWWPCSDYPEWIKMIRDAVRKYSDSADIVFCTYNWGYAPEKDRLKLISALPNDICLMATWDMFHKYKVGNSIEDICDYTLSFEGPGEYFLSEAQAAHKKGLKVYSISNTSGKTWDFGVAPYEPMPQQWIKRYKKIIEAHKNLNLSGLWENIHYAFYPSFINDLEKELFFTNPREIEVLLDNVLKKHFENNANAVKLATEYFSEAITHYVATNEDQYGAFRIGPAYPLWSNVLDGLPSSIPNQGRKTPPKHAMHKNIYFGVYTPDSEGKNSLPGVRIFDEIKECENFINLMQQGIDLLDNTTNRNFNLKKLLNLAKFIKNTAITALNVKKHYVLKQKLSIAQTKENAQNIIEEIEKILIKEKENVINTIPLIKNDSALGWEPSMEYVCDTDALDWKIKQLEYELNVVMKKYQKANSLTL